MESSINAYCQGTPSDKMALKAELVKDLLQILRWYFRMTSGFSLALNFSSLSLAAKSN